MKARPYQQAATDALFHYFSSHPLPTDNPVVAAPTGTGKAFMIANFMAIVLRQWPGQRILNLVHVKELVEQNAATMRRIWPQAPLGIFSAGLKQRVAHMPITFAGTKSVAANLASFGRQDIVIVDECHLIPEKEESEYQKVLAYFRALNPNLRVVGFSATPFRTGLGMITDGNIFTHIAYDLTGMEPFNWLIDEGYLSPLIPIQTEMVIDVSKVARSGGDFVAKHLQDAVNREYLTRAALRETMVAAANRNHWLIFASGIEHAEAVRDMLVKEFGVPTNVVHGKMSAGDRDKALEDFKAGKVRACVNNNILCLDEETEILTSDGFVGIDRMTPKHRIAAWRQDGGVEYAPPQNIVRRQRFAGERMVSFGGGRAAPIRVTSNHRIVVYNRWDRDDVKVEPAENLVGKYSHVPCFGTCEPERVEVITPRGKHSRSRMIATNAYNYRQQGQDGATALEMATRAVDRRLSMRYANPHELTEDDCRFVGFWLGDGTWECGESKRISVSQSLRYADNVAWFDNLLQSIGLQHSKSIKEPSPGSTHPSVRWTFARGTGWGKQATQKGTFYLEPYLDKSGSFLFRHLNRKQLNALLEGFWLADGNHHSFGIDHKQVIGTQYSLYSILQEVCAVRGVSSTITPLAAPTNAKHSQQYRFSWGTRQRYHYSPKNVHLETNDKQERVWCVTSSTSFLICRRRGKVFVTGNTTGFDMPHLDCIVCLRPTDSVVLHVQILGRGTRPLYAPGYDLETRDGRHLAMAASGKRNCIAEGSLVLTDAGLVPIESVTTAMRVWDGAEWVCHDGVIFQGEKHVIQYAGLGATPDHEVYTAFGKMRFERCASQQVDICCTGSGRRPIRLSENHLSRCNEIRKWKKIICKGSMRNLWKNRVERFLHAAKRTQWLSHVCRTEENSKMALSAVCSCSAKMSKPEEQSFQGLWRARYTISFQLCDRARTVCDDFTGFFKKFANRSYRKQPTLPNRKFEMVNAISKHEQPAKTKEPVRVYDILNAGPRHRFTVNGLLVSNCLVLDFAGNVSRLGPINDPRIPKRKGEGAGDVPVKLCTECGCLNHISNRFCDNCGSPFPIIEKITEKASTAQIIAKHEPPKVEPFTVDRITYEKNAKPGRIPTLKVMYWSGLQRFTEHVCLEHFGNPIMRKAHAWWKERTDRAIPGSVDEAMSQIDSLRQPKQIRVWINAKPPEVRSAIFD